MAYDNLKQIQQQLGISEYKLKQDEPTRWNSSLYMLQSVVEQKMSVAAYGSDGTIPVLMSAQLDIANKVINVLSPVEEVTRSISEDKACIFVIPLVRGLRKTLEQSGENRGVRSMKSAMLESLQNRFCDTEETDFLVLSIMLDPRFKDNFLVQQVLVKVLRFFYKMNSNQVKMIMIRKSLLQKKLLLKM